jgi:tRNA-dihydrouridine synthase
MNSWNYFLIMKRPVGIQIFEGDEEAMALSKIVTTVRPDIDINFGCPVKVVCKGAGAGVLKDVDLMIRLTKAVINTDLPVTVKTV